MSTLAPIVRRTAVEIAMGYMARRPMHWGLKGYGMVMVACLFLAIGLVYLIVAAGQVASLYFEPPVAMLIIGGLLIAIASLIIWIGRRRIRIDRLRRELEFRRNADQVAALITDEMIMDIWTPIRDNPKAAMALAAAAGYIIHSMRR